MKSNARISTYMLFDGTCAEAMRFYQSCLGGTLSIVKVGDSAMKASMPEPLQDKVLNARLQSGEMDISASDWMRSDARPHPGNTVCQYVRAGAHDDLASLFGKLSEGATVTDPLKKVWFGSYGALNDRFGVRWMFHADASPTPVA